MNRVGEQPAAGYQQIRRWTGQWGVGDHRSAFHTALGWQNVEIALAGSILRRINRANGPRVYLFSDGGRLAALNMPCLTTTTTTVYLH